MDMDISLDLYKIFCVVVKTGNMSFAAKELYISQPAVSMSVKQLEERMGTSLLIRSAKGVRTTPEGNVLYEYLSQAMSLVKTAEKKFLEMTNLETGEIRIGASDTVISNFLMPYLERYNGKNVNINIKVTNKTTYECLKLLKSGSVDLCFINLPIEEDDNLDVRQCLCIQDCLVGGKKFSKLIKEGVDIKDIGKYPLLLLEDLSNSRRYLNKYAADNGVILNPIIELGSSDLLLEFARINLGITFVIKEFAKNMIDNKKIFEIPLYPVVPKRSIGIVKLRGVALSTAASSFAGMFEYMPAVVEI